MAIANAQIVYETLIKNPTIFFDYLNEQEQYDDFKNQNIITINHYEELLERHILKKSHKEGLFLRETLSVQNLIAKGICHYGERMGIDETLIFVSHLIEMFKNIYSEFGKPLNKTDFEKYETLMLKEKEYYKNSTLRKSLDLDERIESTSKILMDATESIKGSIGNLKYRVSHLSSFSLQEENFEKTKLKYKETKVLYDRYIKPLYHFTNEKFSHFIKELLELRNFLEKEDKSNLYPLKRKLDFYRKKYLFLIEEVRPIREYISNYIREGELYLKRNYGNEKLFNQIESIIEENSRGKKIGESSLISMDVNRLKNVNLYFENNSIKHGKDFTIKAKPTTEDEMSFLNLFLSESLDTIKKDREIKKILNKNFERHQKKKEKTEKRKKELEHIQDNFTKLVKGKITSKDEFELTGFIVDFLKENKFDFTIGELQYFIIKFMKMDKRKITTNKLIIKGVEFIYGKEKTIEKFNKRLTYKELVKVVK